MMCDPRHRLACLLLIGSSATGLAADVHSAELRLLAPYAVKAAVEQIAVPWAKENGVTLHVSWSVPSSIGRRIIDDEPFDVVITTEAGIDRLSRRGKLAIHTKTPFARTASTSSKGSNISQRETVPNRLLDADVSTRGSIGIIARMTARYIQQSPGPNRFPNAIEAANPPPAVGVRLGGGSSRDEEQPRFGSGSTVACKPLAETVWVAALHWNEVMVSQMSGIDLASQLLKRLELYGPEAIRNRAGLEPQRR